MGSINIFKPKSTFHKAALLINLSRIANYFLWKNEECWELNPGQLGLEVSMLNIVLCCPPWPDFVLTVPRNQYLRLGSFISCTFVKRLVLVEISFLLSVIFNLQSPLEEYLLTPSRILHLYQTPIGARKLFFIKEWLTWFLQKILDSFTLPLGSLMSLSCSKLWRLKPEKELKLVNWSW